MSAVQKMQLLRKHSLMSCRAVVILFADHFGTHAEKQKHQNTHISDRDAIIHLGANNARQPIDICLASLRYRVRRACTVLPI